MLNMAIKWRCCFVVLSALISDSLLAVSFSAMRPISLGWREDTPSKIKHFLSFLLAGTTTASDRYLTDPGKALDLTDDFDFVCHFTEVAIHQRGTEQGLDALQMLADKCRQRVSYRFDNDNLDRQRDGSVVSHIDQLLSPNLTETLLSKVQGMESNGWISTNPDSVDGLPSLHLNLVSHGQPFILPGTAKNDFEQGLEELLEIVEDPIYNSLLPRVRELLNTTSIQVSDIFLRRYGQDVCKMNRRGMSAHYDVFSRVTSVVALDNVAVDGCNGLYTLHLSDSDTRRLGRTSNHAALRRFFPLRRGDGVVHSWDVLHGVDVEPHLDRTSLIIWFTQESNECEEALVSPWLLDKYCNDDGKEGNVADFVLASALSTLGGSGFDAEVLERGMETYPNEKELYLRSANHGNTFALTRMGSLVEERALDNIFLQKAIQVADNLHDASRLPAPLCALSQSNETRLALRFWYEGAIQGNPLAQQALADELMVQASETGDEDTQIIAAVLFALAAQQGNEDATDALSRVIDFDLAFCQVQDEHALLESPVVQIAQVAMSHH